jgi:hypothetical protein
MALVRSVSLFASLVVLASSALLGGCGGKTIGDDLTAPNNPNNPNDPPPDPVDPVCPAIAPACDPGDRSVGSEAGCGGADYCYSRTQACSQSVVWCAHDEVDQCDAVPTCNKGDVTVSMCPASTPVGVRLSCYTRSVCGTTISCVHPESACTALPQCNAGDIEVTAIDTCSKPGIDCYPVSECNFTIHCYTP